MKYALVNISQAESAGIRSDGHRKTTNGYMIVNEKEVMQCASLHGTMEQRSLSIGGETMSLRELQDKISKNEIVYE